MKYPIDLFSSTITKIGVNVRSYVNTVPPNVDLFDWLFLESEFPEYKEAVSEAIKSLLNKIDFLGYQLSHSLGNLSEKEYKEIESKYLTPPNNYDIDALSRKIEYLLKITNIDLDAEELSMAFNCEIDSVCKALTTIAESTALHA